MQQQAEGDGPGLYDGDVASGNMVGSNAWSGSTAIVKEKEFRQQHVTEERGTKTGLGRATNLSPPQESEMDCRMSCSGGFCMAWEFTALWDYGGTSSRIVLWCSYTNTRLVMVTEACTMNEVYLNKYPTALISMLMTKLTLNSLAL